MKTVKGKERSKIDLSLIPFSDKLLNKYIKDALNCHLEIKVSHTIQSCINSIKTESTHFCNLMKIYEGNSFHLKQLPIKLLTKLAAL